MKKLTLRIIATFFVITAYSAFLKNVPVDLTETTLRSFSQESELFMKKTNKVVLVICCKSRNSMHKKINEHKLYA